MLLGLEVLRATLPFFLATRQREPPRNCVLTAFTIQSTRLSTPAKKTKNHTTGELHPRNLHRAPYDFAELTRRCPDLIRFLRAHPVEGRTIDFADATAVTTLNRALLKTYYGLEVWDLPEGYLCPPIPGRADYLHHTADLLAGDLGRGPPTGPATRVLDIGMGANCVYPFLGASLYGWNFLGTDLDANAVDWARKLIAANPPVVEKIECRRQLSPRAIFQNVIKKTERFALSVCNPPFHASAQDAEAGTLRKLKNLGEPHSTDVVRNFGGRSNELWCEGGEAGFIRRMIAESVGRPELCVWFTTLVSKAGNLSSIERALAAARPIETRTIPLFAGQKQSRFVAWTFLDRSERKRRLSACLIQSPDLS